MKLLVKLICLGLPLLWSFWLQAQISYPDPDFIREVYYLRKDSVYSLVRLEKNSSKMETKVKAAGFGGAENGYTIDGEKSGVRLKDGKNLSFIFSTGASATRSASSPQQDSMMRANGFDPSMMQGFESMNDPINTISLYKLEAGKKQRKILLQKNPGAIPFGSKKIKSSDKFTFSIKKIREGYWELLVDKSLSKGEYAFTLAGTPGGVAGDITLFAFAID